MARRKHGHLRFEHWSPVLAAVIMATGGYLAATQTDGTGGAVRSPITPAASAERELRCDPAQAVDGPHGDILRPRRGEGVERTYMIEGTACGIPSGKHLWVAVETAAGLSPKTPEVEPSRTGRFAVNVRDLAEIPEGFSVVLLLVGARGHEVIVRWLETGDRTGSFPPLHDEEIPGISRLDVNAGLSFAE
jgi:hypothetical protein